MSQACLKPRHLRLPDSRCLTGLVPTRGSHHGYTSLRVENSIYGRQAGKGLVAATNRGIGNEGLYIQSGKSYEGYFFAKVAKTINVSVLLRNYVDGSILASENVTVTVNST